MSPSATLSLSLNFTYMDGSVRSAYSTSESAMAVSHLGHQLTTRTPRSNKSFSCACLRVHQAASRYSSLSVMYGSSQLSHTPSSLNCTVISSLCVRAKSLHFDTKLPIPYSKISFLDLKPRLSSTLTSIGSPCISQPALSKMACPFMDL